MIFNGKLTNFASYTVKEVKLTGCTMNDVETTEALTTSTQRSLSEEDTETAAPPVKVISSALVFMKKFRSALHHQHFLALGFQVLVLCLKYPMESEKIQLASDLDSRLVLELNLTSHQNRLIEI